MPVDARQLKINKNADYIADPQIRQALYKQFTPNFCFHKDEINFPADPNDIVRNIITAKRALYIDIQTKRPLTDKETIELAAINQYFWIPGAEGTAEPGKFNENYHLYQNELEFIQLSEKAESTSPHPQFLLLDEKHYGKRVGELFDVTGILPQDYPGKKGRELPPCCAAICPTEEGFCINYEFVYPLNNGITGLRWLRNILPESWCQKLSDLGFHYGDCEGVTSYFKINEDGEAVYDGMRTWAHGRDFSRRVRADECTYDEAGHPCVYVGLGGHPSYADNFIGRNKALDLVGDAYHIIPEKFYDTSKDVLSASYALTDKEITQAKSAFPDSVLEAAKALPPALSAFRRIADSNPTTFSCEVSSADTTRSGDLDPVANTYKPDLAFTKFWQKLVGLSKGKPPVSYHLGRVISDAEMVDKPLCPTNCRNILSFSLLRGKIMEDPSNILLRVMLNYEPQNAQGTANIRSSYSDIDKGLPVLSPSELSATEDLFPSPELAATAEAISRDNGAAVSSDVGPSVATLSM